MTKFNFKQWLSDGLGGRDWRGTSNYGYKIDRLWTFVMLIIIITWVILHLLGGKL